MKKISSLVCAFLVCITARAQFSDNFSDGDFTNDPGWNTNGSDWIVNADNQLQSNNATANSTFFITTPSAMASVAQWELYVQLAFNTSSSNYADIFLTASSNDLLTADGYFVRIGYTTDEISLYKRSGGSITKIIDGIDGTTNSSNNTVRIKVTRDAADKWKLYRDLSGNYNYALEGSTVDNTYHTSVCFGIMVKQSTVASFAQKHFFDDIIVQTYIPDLTPPSIISASPVSSNAIDVLFNESVDVISSQVAANFSVNNGIGSPLTAVSDAMNSSLVHLTFSNDIPNGSSNIITVSGVEDVNGNILINGIATFIFYKPQQYDVVIDEIMADPTPQVALPNTEWIELKNTSAFPIHLAGWKLQDANGTSSGMPDTVLMPDSFVIVCSPGSAATLSVYGKTITLANFPSLDNNGELISLTDASGKIIHSVNYSINWYSNELKQDGGWSLEMIDTKNPCSGNSNWIAGTDISGGTPGRKNSVDAINTDDASPHLLRAYTTDSTHIVLVFNETINSITSSENTHYTVSDGIGTPLYAAPATPVSDRVTLQLNTTLQAHKTYTVTVTGIPDCSGNTIGSNNSAKVGLSEPADSTDIVINEILFNPPSNGFDYVELYNKSNNTINLQQTWIANRNSTGTISSITQLSAEPYLLFPNDFILITENASWVKNNFITKNIGALIEISAMPSYNDDEGDVIILNAQGEIIDELQYSNNWHFKLLTNTEAVALERIDYNAPTQETSNWHSAAASVNYGTPTYQNSQFRMNDGVKGEMQLSPGIVSPDNDGQDDFATIDYNFPEPGYMATITIFNAGGRPVRFLQRNTLCGSSGSFRWDGLGEMNQPLSTGVYIMLAEVFNLNGKKKLFKKAIVVARKN